MPEIKLRNVKVYYEKYELPKENKKPPILLIHGFLSSTHSFRKIIPLLREHYSVFSLDLPGFGKSEKALNFTYSYHNYGTLIIDFIKKMNLAKVILIGRMCQVFLDQPLTLTFSAFYFCTRSTGTAL